MLKKSNFDFDLDEDLSALFVLSAWHELFDGFTADSYQPRLHNVPSLIEELVAISKLWKNSLHLKVHADQIKAELKNAVKDESDLLAEAPRYRTSCRDLLNAQTPEAMICAGQLLQGMKDEYWQSFVRLARRAIAALPTRKEDALRFIRRLATFAFQNGKEDDDVWRPFQNTSKKSAVELFDGMIDETQREKQSYIVLLATIGDPSAMKSIARARGFTVVSPRRLS
jgi:hypothetical protein